MTLQKSCLIFSIPPFSITIKTEFNSLSTKRKTECLIWWGILILDINISNIFQIVSRNTLIYLKCVRNSTKLDSCQTNGLFIFSSWQFHASTQRWVRRSTRIYFKTTYTHTYTYVVRESAVMLANIPVVHCKQLIENLYPICRQFDCEWYLHPSASNTFLALALAQIAVGFFRQFPICQIKTMRHTVWLC